MSFDVSQVRGAGEASGSTVSMCGTVLTRSAARGSRRAPPAGSPDAQQLGRHGAVDATREVAGAVEPGWAARCGRRPAGRAPRTRDPRAGRVAAAAPRRDDRGAPARRRATSHTSVDPCASSASRSVVPSVTSACVVLAAMTSAITWVGCSASASVASTGARGRVAARQPPVPRALLTPAAHRERVEVGTRGEGLAGEFGPAQHRDRLVVREGEQGREASGCAVGAYELLGLPCRLRGVRGCEHARRATTTGHTPGDGAATGGTSPRDRRDRRRTRPGSRPPRPPACGRRRRGGRSLAVARTASSQLTVATVTGAGGAA